MATNSNDFLEKLAKAINGVASLTAYTYMALEKGTDAEDATDTALQTEATETGMARKAATCTYEASYKSKWVASFLNGSGSAVSITGFGLFNASSSGDMAMRHLFAAAQSVNNGVTLEITATETVA